MATVTLTPTTALHKAYWFAQTNDASPYTDPSPAVNEISSVQYIAVQSDDAAYSAPGSANATTINKYANVAHLFTFDLSAYNTGGKTITSITIYWDGYRSVCKNPFGPTRDDVMYKDSAGNWQIGATTIEENNDSAGVAYSQTFNSGFPLISNILRFGPVTSYKRVVVNETAGLYSDYAAVSVTYSEGTAHTATITEVFGALDSKTRAKTTHRTFTELFGTLDAKTRVKTIHRTLTEALGTLDVKTRLKTINRAFSDVLGGLDVEAGARGIYRSFAELLGTSDSETRLKTVNRTFLEALGGLDSQTRVKTIYREITEKLGLQDSKSRAKSIFRSILETLGLLDTFSGTTGGIPPSTVDSGSPTIPKSLDLTIGEYGLFALIVNRLRRKRIARLSTHIDAETQTPAASNLKKSIIAALIEEGMSEGEAEEQYAVKAESVYTFVAVGDGSCENCLDYNGNTFTLDEIDAEFPYAEEVGEGLILPWVHPNCQCTLNKQ
ncbi:hypothetical protein MUP79_01680 [Candidatus Bathyarchaeota archaeon]|nr:hypothetical protein [Candidatus Bathyarchaeota archaeon]